MRITRIESQKRRPGRKNVYADGEFLAGVSAETLLRLALRTGDELSPEQVRVLKKTEELVSAKAVALRFLATRPRTVREVRDRLREKEFGDREIVSVLEELRGSGLLNDEEFARAYVRDALALKPSGEHLLRRKLLLLGIEKPVVDRTLGELIGERERTEQVSRAAETFLRRAGKGRTRESAEKLRQRLGAYLARRGFAWDVIEGILNKSVHRVTAPKDE